MAVLCSQLVGLVPLLPHCPLHTTPVIFLCALLMRGSQVVCFAFSIAPPNYCLRNWSTSTTNCMYCFTRPSGRHFFIAKNKRVIILVNINFRSIGFKFSYSKFLFKLHAFVDLLFDKPCLHIMMSLFWRIVRVFVQRVQVKAWQIT